jgi:hypothetical protein
VNGTPRSADDLADVDDPAWPLIQDWLRLDAHRVLPISPDQGRHELERVQVTARSGAGALSLNCGGILADHGWLKVFGGGARDFPSLADMTGSGLVVCAVDVIGGVFAADWGGLGSGYGEVHYWPFDTANWEPCGFGHFDFLQWALAHTDNVDGFYRQWRWEGWQSDVEGLAPDVGMSLSPPPWSREGHDIANVSRRAVPMVEVCRELQTLHALFPETDPYPIDWRRDRQRQ